MCNAIIDEFKSEVMPVPVTQDEWAPIAEGFMERWQFPHTLGALDGKHIACRRPPGSGSEYFNYKKFYSIVLLALVDSDYKFIWGDLGAKGSNSDAQIWNDCDLHENIKPGPNQTIFPPDPTPLPNDTEDMPYYFIGDDAFALRSYMMKPYGHRGLTEEERIFNYRLSRARRVVENAFGIMANRFQVLLSTMQHHESTVRLITGTCMVLHNMMRIRYPTMHNRLVDREDRDHNIIPGEWRQGRNMRDTEVVRGSTRSNREGKKLQNLLKHWCNSEAGQVPWQRDMI